MKGILSNRLLEQAVHCSGTKKRSKPLYRQRRLRKQLKTALTKIKFSTGYLKSGKQSLGKTNAITSVSNDDKHLAVNINEGDKRGETQTVRVLNMSVTKEVSQLPKDDALPKVPTIPPEWHAAVQSIIASSEGIWSENCSAPIVLICGRKNAGKSTFARFLVNSLFIRYSKVGFLDTDVGQPELTPSGCLSLHVLDKPILGLPSLEMKNPERCYFYGDISPKGDPESYLSNISTLYNYFRNKYQVYNLEDQVMVQNRVHVPLVINTHGWVEGVGFDVLVEILRYILPTHVVQVLVRASSQNLPHNRFWDLNCSSICNTKLLYVNSVVERNNQLAEIKFNARELRDLRVVSYFQNCLKVNLTQNLKLPDLYRKAAMSLAACKPYQVPISAIKVVHVHYQVPSFESSYTLNAALVGLGVSSTFEKYGKLLEKVQPFCIGLGIVRGVDVQRGIFYVITPLPLEKLQQVDTFLHGNVQVPIPLLKAPGYISPYLCRNAISIEGTGAAAMGSGKKKFLRP